MSSQFLGGPRVHVLTDKILKLMLSTIAVILIVLWLLGLVSAYTIGGFIHILLVIAIILFVVRLFQGRNPV